MASLKNVTKEAILQAIGEYDRLGAEKFHAKHGTSPSTKFVLQHGGKAYPSKAIIAVAAGLSPEDFSGGSSRLQKLVEKFGFGWAQLSFAFAAAIAVSAPAPTQAEPGIGQTGRPAAYFASGSSRPADIRGFAAIGHAIGVAADELSPNAENELHAIAGSGVPVFVDSGAFSEVEFNVEKMGFDVVKPIVESDWQDKMDLYNRLAASYAERGAAGDLYLVAPDMVGNQDVTLERLARWKNEVNALVGQGARVLVCIQKGAMSQVEFYDRCVAVLGHDNFVAAMPCKKGATTAAELRAFLAARKPARIHLLGLGEKNRNVDAYLAAVRDNAPAAVVTLDSNKIAASVGRGGGKPRILTAARDMAAKLIEAGKTTIKSAQELGIILAFGAGYQLALFA